MLTGNSSPGTTGQLALHLMVWGFCLDNARCPIVCVAMSTTIIHGDCLEELKKLEDNSIDAVVCDPPYGLSNTKPAQVADVLKAWVTGDTVSVPAKRGGFMGADWDSFVPPPAVWEECMRVLKPGGHMAVFAGARTQDLMGLSIRLAGFEIRDTLGWVYGSGFPKSMDISKAIDRDLAKVDTDDARARSAVARQMRDALDASGKSRREIDEHFGTANVSQYWFSPDRNSQIVPADKWAWVRDWLGVGAELDAEVWRLNGLKGQPQFDLTFEREVVGVQKGAMSGWNIDGTTKFADRDITTPATSEAQRWDGWGTSLKPAIEPIILARKPLDGTVANNVLAHGVGGLNIDACRVEAGDLEELQKNWDRTQSANQGIASTGLAQIDLSDRKPAGRFPANVLLDEHAAKEMDKQSGVRQAGGYPASKGVKSSPGANGTMGGGWAGEHREHRETTLPGGASRFFPVFKYQAKAPKKERPVIEREDGTKIQHNTVKPLALMEWLVSLIVPPGGVVLDPFAGSGTTLQAALNKGFQPIGIEQDADYIKLIEQRLAA